MSCNAMMPPMGPTPLPEDDELFPCCMGSAMRGPEGCTCWTPVMSRVQQEPTPGPVTTRAAKCHDCAYRSDSPEFQRDPYALLDIKKFYCHQGMVRVVAWKHPDGRVRDADFGDYRVPVVDEVSFLANGKPAQLCAGWAACQEED